MAAAAGIPSLLPVTTEVREPLGLEGASLMVHPQPYVASPYHDILRAPWAVDYAHLTFWWFYFAAFTLAVFLLYVGSFLMQLGEQRAAVRETRGYSRAQTGDLLTAVLPLAWSATMLAHASAHSATFDDNATGTVFSVSVVAYQWGWNYYFPRELVDLFAAAPKQVGRGRILDGAAQLPYTRLLEQWRVEACEKVLKPAEMGVLPGLTPTSGVSEKPTVGSRLTHIYRSLASFPNLSISGVEVGRTFWLLRRLGTLQGLTLSPLPGVALAEQGLVRLRGAARALTNTAAPVVGTRLNPSNVGGVELGLPSLDVSQSGRSSGLESTLPLPTLDLDPASTLGKWAGELTTTRQSDYTTKFWTLWGPALRGVSGPAASSPALVWLGAWGLHSTGVTSTSVTQCNAPAMRAEQLTALCAQPIRGWGAWWAWRTEPSLTPLFEQSQLNAYLALAANAGRVAGLRLGCAYTQTLADTPNFSENPPQARAGFEALDPDVRTMRRLRVTAGIYLPADTPIHGMFGSKDVIHSWAIPGLGLKIDCIPGYSSHRRIMLRWRGAYWGQCMEVCGRYHHWMPILVRVVHRDVFLAWCLGYVRGIQPSRGGSNVPTLQMAREAWAAVQTLRSK